MPSVRIADGTKGELAPDCIVDYSPGKITVERAGRLVTVDTDSEQCLPESSWQVLQEAALGTVNPASCFDSVDLNDGMFGSLVTSELAILLPWIEGAPEGRGLDVGCGSGRLLLPLVEAGLALDGVDPNRAALAAARWRVAGYPVTLYPAPVEEWSSLSLYSFAFAALNTVRYLSSHWAFARHLVNLAQCIRPDGVYIVNCTVNNEPEKPYGGGWAFSAKGCRHTVQWRWYRYLERDRRIVESVEIRHPDDGSLCSRELQSQLAFDGAKLLQALVRTGHWEVADIVDHRGRSVAERNRLASGTYWVKLKRTAGTA